MASKEIHIFEQVVQFEDVDAAAIVYHPVYLSYLERARNQVLLDRGFSFRRILEAKIGFVVGAVEMKYVRPLGLGDRFFIATQVNSFERSVFSITQAIALRREDLDLSLLKDELRQIESLRFFAHLKVFVISTESLRPVRLPDWMSEIVD